jgi:hypothetical protein
MHDALRRYCELTAAPNNGASEGDIRALEQLLGAPLPMDLVALYQHQDGATEYNGLPWRFMSLAEVHEWHDMMHTYYAEAEDFNWLEHGLSAFWSDDSSNYVGLYLTGPLRGYACFLKHEESNDIAPGYHSVVSFLQASMQAAEHGLGWFEMQTEYPVCDRNTAASYIAEDSKVLQSLHGLLNAGQTAMDNSLPDSESRGNWQERLELEHYAFCIMALLPFEHTSTLYDFVQNKDMYIQERACEILGCRRDENAISLLAEVATHGTHNGQLAAIRALGQIGTRECLAQIRRLIELLPDGYEPHIAGALEGCGCEVTHEGGQWLYRLPDTPDWVPITLRR